MRKADRSRSIKLDGGINFRDLGGYKNIESRTVRWRKIFRSGHLADISDSDINELKRFGLTEIHDFRRDSEQIQSPTGVLPFRIIDDYQISIGDISKFWEFLSSGRLTSGSAHELVVNSYRQCVTDVVAPFSRFLKGIARNSNNASLFHCSAGKDRTGMAAALLLSCLDVPRETIVQDYLLTQKYYKPEKLIKIIESHLRDADVHSWERSWLIPYVSVHEQNINAFLDSIDLQFGSMKNFIQGELEVSAEELSELQNNFLEG